MTARVIFDRPCRYKSAPTIEFGRLEIVGLQYDECASPRQRFLFDPIHQLRAESLSAHRFRNDQVFDIARRTPGPAIGSADHFAILVAQEDAVELAVGVA